MLRTSGFVTAINPCPCGYYGDLTHECTCSVQSISRYQKRISGPPLDRIDIHIEAPRVDVDKLTADRLGEPSEAIRAQVEAAREVQRERFVVWAVREPPLYATPTWGRPRYAESAS